MSKIVDVDGVRREFPDDATDEEIDAAVQAEDQGSPVAGAAPAPTPPAAVRDLGEGAIPLSTLATETARGVGNFVKGAGQGALSLGRGAVRLGQQAGVLPAADAADEAYDDMLTPDTTEGRAGKLVEQAAEGMALPATKGAGLLKGLTKAGLSAAALEALQTGKFDLATLAAGIFGTGAEGAQRAIGKVAANVPAAREAAEDTYRSVLGTSKANRPLAEAAIPEAVERGAQGSLKKMLGVAEHGVERTGEDVGLAVAQNKDAYISTTPLLKDVNDAIAHLKVRGAKLRSASDPNLSSPLIREGGEVEGASTAALEKLKEQLEGLGDLLPVDQATKLKRIYQDTVARAGGFGSKAGNLADASTAAASEEGRQAIGREIADQFPDIAEANREHAFWQKWKTVLDEANDKDLYKTGKGVPLTGRLLAKTLDTPAFRTGSAQARLKVAKALTEGRWEEAAKLMRAFAGAGISSARMAADDEDDRESRRLSALVGR